MSDIIKLLPESVANQIAAGEVVQRPSSVVKELVENAIDAKSNEITVIVKDAGRTLIQVIDSGIGMSSNDARMSLERHATSKIAKAEDLFEIFTKGFRGEAIASIAAVSQMEVKTKRFEDELGTYLIVEGSRLKEQSPIVCENGTTFIVKNLFYNIPARRNFLKTDVVEMRHIIDEFIRVAIAHPEIKFSLFNNDLNIYNLEKSDLQQRIIDLFGKNYRSQLAKCEEKTPEISVFGYVGNPSLAKKTRGEQFIIVNNRFIKNAYLNHAISNAYQGLIPKDLFPFFVLQIFINPKKIDINVHPTKTEIKFDNEKLIYSIIETTVKKSLGVYGFSPSIDFESSVNFNLSHELNKEHVGHKLNISENFEKTSTSGWENMFDDSKINTDFLDYYKNEKEENTIVIGSKLNNESENNSSQMDLFTSVNERDKTAIHFLNKYIITPIKSGLLIINQKMAHERILYEKYLQMMNSNFGSAQQFLFPQTVELSSSDFELVKDIENEIKALGFVFNHFGKNTLVINGIPSDVQPGKEKEIFEELLEQFKHNKAELKLDKKENLARALSKRTSINNKKLSLEEMNSLIDQLFSCKTPGFNPDGKKTMLVMNENSIYNLFQ